MTTRKDYDNTSRGRKPNQKLKAYLVMQYLLRRTDDTHAVTEEQS